MVGGGTPTLVTIALPLCVWVWICIVLVGYGYTGFTGAQYAYKRTQYRCMHKQR